jgi:hypothetical protein
MVKASAGGYYAAGLAMDQTTNKMGYLVARLDNSSNLLWAKRYEVDSTLSMYEPYELLELPGHSIAFLSYVGTPNSAITHSIMMRLDSAGQPVGTTLGNLSDRLKAYGGLLQGNEVIITGHAQQHGNVVARVDLNGTGICSELPVGILTTDITASFNTVPQNVVETNMPTVITDGTWDILTHGFVRTVACGNPSVSMTPNTEQDTWQVFPQPNNGSFKIQHPPLTAGHLTMYALDGKQVATYPLNQQSTETTVHATQLPAGLYFLQVSAEGHPQRLKVWIQ